MPESQGEAEKLAAHSVELRHVREELRIMREDHQQHMRDDQQRFDAITHSTRQIELSLERLSSGLSAKQATWGFIVLVLLNAGTVLAAFLK